MKELYENEEMEIDLVALLFVLLRKWWLIIICGVCGGALFLGATVLFVTPKYQSQAVLYVLSKTTSLTSMADLQIGSELADDFLYIAKSKPVVDKVVEKLNEEEGKNFTRDEVLDMLSVSNEGTRMLSIYVTSESPTDACLLANAIAEATIDRMAEVTKTDPPSKVESAEVPVDPISPSILKNTVIGGFLGALLVILILAVLFIRNDNIKSEEDVEKYLGLSTLVVLPIEPKRNRKK